MNRNSCAAALILAFAASCAPIARAQGEEQAAPADEPQAPAQAAPEAPAQSEPAAPQTDAPEAQPAPIRPGKAGAGAAGVTFGHADTGPRSHGSASPAGRGSESGGGVGEPGGAAGSNAQGATKGCPDGPSYDSTPATKFDFAKTEIMNSPSDAASWPVTATITKLDIGADGFHVDFTKRDGPGRWTDVRTPGWGGDLEYTLWMVESIDGQWYASGPVEYWNGLDRSGGAPSRVYDNWFYAADRWGPMACHQPRVGEKVGFLVTHGDARNGGNGSRPSKERSNVVFMSYPSDRGAVFDFGGN